jgi:hypothetical protein
VAEVKWTKLEAGVKINIPAALKNTYAVEFNLSLVSLI